MYMKKRKKAFTLIELLVVISIIALLLSILMPALNSARDRARRLICSTNLHQFGLGVVMYAQNNNSYVPSLDPITNLRIDAVHFRAYWHSVYGWGQFGIVWHWLALLYPDYITDGKVFYCPGSWVKYKDYWKFYGDKASTEFVWTYWAQPSAITLSGLRTHRITDAGSRNILIWDGTETNWNDGSVKRWSWHTMRKTEGQNQLLFDGSTHWVPIGDKDYLERYMSPFPNYP